VAEAVFLDNTVLCKFAAVHRLDLLKVFLRGRGRWTEAAAHEGRRYARYLPDLGTVEDEGWLGQPIEVDNPAMVAKVEHLRRDVFGGSSVEPLKHLGEPQTCYLVHEVARWRGRGGSATTETRWTSPGGKGSLPLRPSTWCATSSRTAISQPSRLSR